MKLNFWAQFFQKVNDAIHEINLYPVDSGQVVSLILIKLLDSAIQPETVKSVCELAPKSLFWVPTCVPGCKYVR